MWLIKESTSFYPVYYKHCGASSTLYLCDEVKSVFSLLVLVLFPTSLLKIIIKMMNNEKENRIRCINDDMYDIMLAHPNGFPLKTAAGIERIAWRLLKKHKVVEEWRVFVNIFYHLIIIFIHIFFATRVKVFYCFFWNMTYVNLFYLFY